MACLNPLDQDLGIRGCGLKLLEESSEACEAMKLLDKLLEKASGGEDLVHFQTIEAYKRSALRELADVLQVLTDCLHQVGAGPRELEEAVFNVQDKNESRGLHEMEDTLSLVARLVDLESGEGL